MLVHLNLLLQLLRCMFYALLISGLVLMELGFQDQNHFILLNCLIFKFLFLSVLVSNNILILINGLFELADLVLTILHHPVILIEVSDLLLKVHYMVRFVLQLLL